MKKLITLITISTLLLSCSENPHDLLSENKENAEKKFEQFYACYEIAKTTAPLTENKINWEEEDAQVKYRESNVYQIGFESFKDLSQPLDIQHDGTRRREHADMAKLFNIDLSSHKQPHNYPVDEEYSYQNPDSEDPESCIAAIHHFLDTKYLLINRTFVVTEPVYDYGTEFIPGYVAGDVLVFDVEKGKLLGGFMFDATNHDSVEGADDPMANLKADLDILVGADIKEEFLKLTPFLGDVSFEF